MSEDNFNESVQTILGMINVLATQSSNEEVQEVTRVFENFFRNNFIELVIILDFILRSEVEDNIRYYVFVILKRAFTVLISMPYESRQSIIKDYSQKQMDLFQLAFENAFSENADIARLACNICAQMLVSCPGRPTSESDFDFQETFDVLIRKYLENEEISFRFLPAIIIYKELADCKFWRDVNYHRDQYDVFIQILSYILSEEFINNIKNSDIYEELLFNAISAIYYTDTQCNGRFSSSSENVHNFLNVCVLWLPESTEQLFRITYDTLAVIAKCSYDKRVQLGSNLPLFVNIIINGLSCSDSYLMATLDCIYEIAFYEYSLYLEKNRNFFLYDQNNRLIILDYGLNPEKTPSESSFISQNISFNILSSEGVLDQLITHIVSIDPNSTEIGAGNDYSISYSANMALRYLIVMTPNILPVLLEIVEKLLSSTDWTCNYGAILILESLSSVFQYSQVFSFIHRNKETLLNLMRSEITILSGGTMIFMMAALKKYSNSLVTKDFLYYLLETLEGTLKFQNTSLTVYCLKLLAQFLFSLSHKNRSGLYFKTQNLLLSMRKDINVPLIQSNIDRVLKPIIFGDDQISISDSQQLYNYYADFISDFIKEAEPPLNVYQVSVLSTSFENLSLTILKFVENNASILDNFMENMRPFFNIADSELLYMLNISFNTLFQQIPNLMKNYSSLFIEKISEYLHSEDPSLIRQATSTARMFFEYIVRGDQNLILQTGEVIETLFNLIENSSSDIIGIFQGEVVAALGAAVYSYGTSAPVEMISRLIGIIDSILSYEPNLENDEERQSWLNFYKFIFYALKLVVYNVECFTGRSPYTAQDGRRFMIWYKRNLFKYISKRIISNDLYDKDFFSVFLDFCESSLSNLTVNVNIEMNNKFTMRILQKAVICDDALISKRALDFIALAKQS